MAVREMIATDNEVLRNNGEGRGRVDVIFGREDKSGHFATAKKNSVAQVLFFQSQNECINIYHRHIIILLSSQNVLAIPSPLVGCSPLDEC